MFKRKSIIILVIIAVVVVALIGYFSRSKPLAVTVSKVETGKVESVVTNTRAGTVKACRRAGLSECRNRHLNPRT